MMRASNRDTDTHPARIAKEKSLTTVSVGENMDQLQLLHSTELRLYFL